MDQVEVKVVNAAGCQLAFKQRQDLLLCLIHGGRQLIRQHIPVSGVAAGEALTNGLLAFAPVVGPCGVKVGKARRQKGIHHLRYLRSVDLLPCHGQAHKAKAEIFLDLRENRIHNRASIRIASYVLYHNGKRPKSKAGEGA